MNEELAIEVTPMLKAMNTEVQKKLSVEEVENQGMAKTFEVL